MRKSITSAVSRDSASKNADDDRNRDSKNTVDRHFLVDNSVHFNRNWDLNYAIDVLQLSTCYNLFDRNLEFVPN